MGSRGDGRRCEGQGVWPGRASGIRRCCHQIGFKTPQTGAGESEGRRRARRCAPSTGGHVPLGCGWWVVGACIRTPPQGLHAVLTDYPRGKFLAQELMCLDDLAAHSLTKSKVQAVPTSSRTCARSQGYRWRARQSRRLCLCSAPRAYKHTGEYPTRTACACLSLSLSQDGSNLISYEYPKQPQRRSE